MANLLSDGATWLAAQLKNNAATSITYRRDAYSVSIAATKGRSIYEQDQGTGVIVRVESRDYILTAADLVINGETVQPKRGDVIEDDGHKYKLYGDGVGPEWDWHDQDRTMIRVHTKQDKVTT